MNETKEVKKPRGRPRKSDKLNRIKTVKLSKSLETELKVYCLRNEKNESQAIRLAIEQLLESEKEKK